MDQPAVVAEPPAVALVPSAASEPPVSCLPTAADFDCRVPRQQYSLGAIGWFVELVLSAPCSQRAAATVVSWVSQLWPGSQEAPGANAGRNWLFRLGLYELTCPQEAADDWVWLVDHTVQLGSHKGLVIVGLLLKKEFEADPDWETFLSESPLARRGLTLTAAGFLVPPPPKAKARYMNVDGLVAWGRKVLAYLESLLGKYKRLPALHSGHGMTRTILALGAVVGRRCLHTLRHALTQVTTRHVAAWCKEHLGLTLQARRKQAFATEQNQHPNSPISTPSF